MKDCLTFIPKCHDSFCKEKRTDKWINSRGQEINLCKKHLEDVKNVYDYNIIDGIYYVIKTGKE